MLFFLHYCCIFMKIGWVYRWFAEEFFIRTSFDDDRDTHLRPFSGTTRVSQYQNVSILYFMGTKDDLLLVVVVVTTGAIKKCKAPVRSSPPTNQHLTFYRPDPLLLPNQHCQSTEGKGITFHVLAHLKFTWGLQTLGLTMATKGAWLPWGRVAKPLISLLTPVGLTPY